MDQQSGSGVTDTTKQDGVKLLQVKKGETFTVKLWEDRTRGEQWVPAYDAKALVLLEDDFLRTTSNNAVDSGSRSFEFQAREVGRYSLEFNKRMAWKFTAEDRRVFSVTVDE